MRCTARPAESGNYPAVIVSMEGMGLMDHHKDIAVRFAGRGFLAIAPDLYTREGTPEPENVLATLFASPDSQAMDRPGRGGGIPEVAGAQQRQGGHHRVLLGRAVHADDGVP